MAAVEVIVSRWNSVCEAAREATAAAAERAAVELRAAESLNDVTAVAELLGTIWERPGEPPISPELLRALAHSGNYVVGAHQDGRLIGALLGFFGRSGQRAHLHSHILGVRGDARVGGVGFALKLHQREWALERRIDCVLWTFDPLVRGNAFFNIAKLGAVGHAYQVNFYGPMPDSINDGDESDRLVVRWPLADPIVAMSAQGVPRLPDIEALRASGATVALLVGADGSPVRGDGGGVGDVVLAQVPPDVVSLRHAQPAAALGWRRALREVMTAAFERGLTVTGMTRDGWYVLSARD